MKRVASWCRPRSVTVTELVIALLRREKSANPLTDLCSSPQQQWLISSKAAFVRCLFSRCTRRAPSTGTLSLSEFCLNLALPTPWKLASLRPRGVIAFVTQLVPLPSALFWRASQWLFSSGAPGSNVPYAVMDTRRILWTTVSGSSWLWKMYSWVIHNTYLIVRPSE